jgi:hypothetical protein
MTVRLVLVFLVGVVAGCTQDPGPTDPSRYNQQCTVDQDCVLVFQRACPCTCDDCRPAAGAVNRSDRERFKHDEEAARPCPQRTQLQGCMVCDCVGESRVAACQCGRCAAVFPDAGVCVAADAGP